MLRQIVWCTFFLIFLSFSMEEDCSTSDDSNVIECCADFYIRDGKCTPCLSGYYGPNCIFTCPYPSFGRRCLEGECQCPQENCDPTTGCRSDILEGITSKNNNGAILEKKTSKGYVGDVNSSTIEENIQSDEKHRESIQSKSPVIVTSVVAAIIIIVLIAVILFQVKGRIQTRIQTLDTKRRSKVTSQRHVDTYCDIDEDKMEDEECNILNDLEPYELIDQSKKDGTKYTELPTRQGVSQQERNLMSTISMQKILNDFGDDDDDDTKHVDGSESKVQMRTDKAHHAVLPKRMGKTSTKISGYIDMRKNTPEDYVSMNAEQLDTEANSQIAVKSVHSES